MFSGPGHQHKHPVTLQSVLCVPRRPHKTRMGFLDRLRTARLPEPTGVRGHASAFCNFEHLLDGSHFYAWPGPEWGQQNVHTHLPHAAPGDQVADDGRVEAHAGDQRGGGGGEGGTRFLQIPYPLIPAHLPHAAPRDQVADDGRVEAYAGDQRGGAHAGELAPELGQQRQVRRACAHLQGWLAPSLATHQVT